MNDRTYTITVTERQARIITDGATRNWPEMMGVDYDEPMHWGKEPLAVIEEVK